MASASPSPGTSDIRWKQRFDNLQRAYKRLLAMLELAAQDPDSDGVRMAVVEIQTRYQEGLEQLHALLSTKLKETP